MDAPTLMQKLMEMTRALDGRDTRAVRNLIIEAQDGVLALERENESLSLENAGLRQRLDAARVSTLTAITQSRIAEPIASSFTGEVSPLDNENPGATRTHIWRTTHFFRT
jgi:regulator of replication initiation timing